MKKTTPRSAGLWPALLLYTAFALGCADTAAATRSNPAASALLERAAQDLHTGQVDQAAATLERALRIEPRNPAILHYLAQTRLQQGRYQQAEALASKSNSLAGNDRLLRERNARLLHAAREGAEGQRPPEDDDSRRLALQQRLDAEIERRHQAEARAAALEARLDRDAVDREDGYRDAHWQEPRRTRRHEERRRYAEELPKGQLPPPGLCRIWFPGRPPGQQPAPGRCRELRRQVPAGAWLVRG